jgi:hypothetical protein
MLDTIEYEGCAWAPPPAPQAPAKGLADLPAWRKISTLAGWWPVRTPRGRQPLPASARVAKAVSTPEVVALHDEAAQRRLGLGAGGPWLVAHLHPDGTHYLVPDPAPYYWPDPEQRPWWQCRELLRMVDGTQATSSVAVLPQRFAALADNLSGGQQRRVVHQIRATRYDLALWGRDHRAECGPDSCGYRPADPAD